MAFPEYSHIASQKEWTQDSETEVRALSAQRWECRKARQGMQNFIPFLEGKMTQARGTWIAPTIQAGADRT